ncbi:MAG: amino acid permease [Burkholderiales bacterium]|nr:amino acid permease [Burkholderiales bacterium]MCE7877949.1 amino acid permease [Betaproteobacteria bacterium PRO3]
MTGSGDAKLSRAALTGLVVGTMIGAGIFTLPGAFGRTTGALGALLAWAIAGGGMLMLAFVFQALAARRPDIDAGIYGYADEGFGPYLGFNAALGYWIGCCLAGTSCLILIKATLGQFFPAFGDGSTTVAIAAASALLWGVHALVLRGVRQAVALNTIATVAKIVPIGIFILVAVAAFRADAFSLNLWGGAPPGAGTVARQARDTLIITVFVFIGIEGASVYSRYARDRSDVGAATVLGFVGTLALLVLVTMTSFGVLPREDLAALPQPSMAGVMAAIVGPWGLVFVSVGLLVAVLGNFLSWPLLASEVLHSAGRTGTMPSFVARENEAKVPAAALWCTSVAIQAFLLVAWVAEHAFTLALKMTSAMMLIPYLLVAGFGLKLAWTGETYGGERGRRRTDLVRAVLATAYAVLMIAAGGVKLVLLSALLYAPGALLYVMARRERGLALFTAREALLCGVLVAAAIVALYALASGALAL